MPETTLADIDTASETVTSRPNGAPFRAELLSLERLADEARGIAATQRLVPRDEPAKTTPLIDLVEQAGAQLTEENRELARAARSGVAVPPAGEWLLDNFYLIEEQLLLVHSDLPAHYGRELPRLASGPHADEPRVYDALLALIAHTDSRIEESHLLAFVEAFQEVSALTIGETWAVPIMLRIGIIENLRRLSAAVTENLRADVGSERWIERLVRTSQDEPEALAATLAELEREERKSSETFYLRLAVRLAELEVGIAEIDDWLARKLQSAEISLERAAAARQHSQAADQVSIANAITSIRFLDAFDWKAFFERVSVVERILRRDPSHVYAAMDFETRDRYRHALELVGRRSDLSELELADQVIALCRSALAANPSDEVRGHVGWWLIREGRYELEERVGYRATLRERIYRGPLKNRWIYFGGLFVLLMLLLVAALASFARNGGASPVVVGVICLLGLLPLSEIAVALLNRVSAIVFPARLLPKLDHRNPIFAEHRTFVVVPALLTSVNGVRSVIANLEVTYLANRDPHIAFGLVGDLRGGPEQNLNGDRDIIEAAVIGIEELNERYEREHGVRPFHLLIRERRFNKSENAWMGWERKRGSLLELVLEMRGDPSTSFNIVAGDPEFRRRATFVLTLDADTVLPRDGARKFIATIGHPLNRARWRPGEGRVRVGHGLVQPRVSMTVGGSMRSTFASMYSGRTGVDPYAQAVSDTYQDVFGEGSFTGKGIFEVDLFIGLLEDRFPENSLLSHDLIEGSFLRTALASDVEVLDDYPANYLAASSRMHRWVRGDWQTLSFLAGAIPNTRGDREANPLTALHRWKIADNLRRSLVPPATMVFLIVGWLLLPDSALRWPIVTLLLVLFPAYFALADALLSRPYTPAFRASVPELLADFRTDMARAMLSMAVLPHQAWLMLDAITRALWRTHVSRRKLLEWETAADAEKRAGTTRRAFFKALGPSVAVGVALLVPIVVAEPTRLWIAVPLATLWLAGPLFAWRVSRPIPRLVAEPLTSKERDELRRVARKTWRFYETFVVPEGHHMAPDNFQEDPNGVVAWRTSPTNIGLQLLGYVNAYDLGYLTVLGLNERTAVTLSAMAGLERFRGHFYNWYDIRTLEPLRPAYVSTVDSGNLAGHLLVLRIGLLEASESPLLGPQLLDGARDAVRLALEDLVRHQEGFSPSVGVRRLREVLDALERALAVSERPSDLGGWEALLRRLEALASEAAHAAEDLTEELPEPDEAHVSAVPVEGLGVAGTPLEQVCSSVSEIVDALHEPLTVLMQLAPWTPLLREVPASARANGALAPLLSFVPSLVGLAEGLDRVLLELERLAAGTDREAAAWAGALGNLILETRPTCIEILARIRLNADIAREMWEHTDFRMLYDENRQLFSIGYNLSEGRLDPSYYDLLASECRLASFLAIAKGDLPQEHWFRLGRSLTRTPQGRALVSWSASMFEYLMPAIVMRDWPATLLTETYDTIVRRQMAYGRERGVPWGVSESAFNAKDAELTYQYQAFGIPGLGLKRGLSDDIVVAPYACILALPVGASAVISNLRDFSAEGGEGRFGFYESLDYTPGRVPAGRSRAVVKSYFAHHHGMSFAAIANAVTGYRLRDRFHADPMVASAELLLQERVPRHVQLVAPHGEEVREVRSVRELPPPVTRSYPTAETPVPSTHFLSNGRYSVMVTNGGGGYSRFRDLAVTRYREDVTRDCWGTFFYVRDAETGECFSAPHNPMPSEPDSYQVVFAPDKAEYRRVDGTLQTALEVAVSPEDDVEVRRLTFTNTGLGSRRLEVTSYFEIALTSQASDQAHKSFSNLFVQTEALDDTNAILFWRRQRSSEEQVRFGFHLVACDQSPCEWSFETDRAAFIGRLRASDDPLAMSVGGELGRSQGAVLDPCCAVRREIVLPPGESVRMVFTTGVASSRQQAIRLTEKYHDPRTAQRAIDLAWTAAQLELRDLGITPAQAVTLERLASRLLLTDPASPLKTKTPTENGLQMSGLWSIGISGDWPILLVQVETLEHAPLVRQALLAHQYWRHKGLRSDLVILNTRPSGYSDELDERLRLLVRTGHALQMLDKPGGVFLRRCDQMHPDVRNLLASVARATLDGDGGSLELQLNQRAPAVELPPMKRFEREPEAYEAPAFVRPVLDFDNGLGGFDPKTGEYVIVLEGDDVTPAPWIDVLANPSFGCTVSEAGVGCTWALNSHENRITTWNNDPVSDGSGEAFYIRDEETGQFWSPTPLPVRTPEPYVVRHGRGVVSFEHDTHGIRHELDWFVAAEDPVRVCRLRLTNRSGRPRRLSVTHFVEWVLGDSRSKAQQLVVTWFDDEAEILTAHNHFNFDFPGRCAFLACDRPLSSWTASRREFVGRNRRPKDPIAMQREGLGRQSGRYHDNCSAMMTEIELAVGQTAEVSFLLGQTDTLEQARRLVATHRSSAAVEELRVGAEEFWEELLGKVRVSTPDKRLDALVNGQLLYQATACRLWGRTATYQSSGAYGFRDQLQDVMALLIARPDLVREQIIEASRHQFPEGDVLHWWQPFSGRGVRTHITDDRHWLPLVVAEYLEATGDTGVLDVRTAFLDGPPLPPDHEDAYLQPATSEIAGTIYEHCVRAIETGRPTGAHDLPLMGGGDWNDGMNRVGLGGHGESVWLAWFLGYVLKRFAPICELRGDGDRARDYLAWADRLAEAIERTSWDGAWYRRAYFDDGTPLGTHAADECRIDAIAQAWATISGLGDPKRAGQALDSVEEKLVRREAGLLALLSPPFDRMLHDPGYIKGYVPGVRENGGQYTHAALWVVLAYLMRGDGDEAAELLSMINPVSHALTREAAEIYKVEPYVVAADVYAVAPHTGRGGWTWYTGSASWFYRVAVQWLLGVRLVATTEGPALCIDPCIPKTWDGFEVQFRHGSSLYRIAVSNPRGVNRGVASVTVDGEVLADGMMPLVDDGAEHEVRVSLLGG